MVETKLRSRSNRRRKKRNNNRNLMIFLALAFLFFTILLSLIVLNKNVDSENEQEEPTQEKEVTDSQSETNKETNESDKDMNLDQEEEKNEEENEDSDTNEAGSSISVNELDQEEIDDPNVEKAFEGEWSPIGTTQEGSHTTNYQNGSQDRIEIKKAVSAVTKVDEDNMVEWRVENGGDQKVIATVSDDKETEYYRVYLTWVDNEGWQVNKLEDLKQNDKK